MVGLTGVMNPNRTRGRYATRRSEAYIDGIPPPLRQRFTLIQLSGMPRFFLPFRLSFVLVLINLAPTLGQTPTDSSSIAADNVLLDEIVVTASKIPLPLRETAKPVQIISREEIRRGAGRDLSQLLQEQAGIIVNGAFSSPGKDKSIFVRGANSEYTLVLIDGQPVSDPTGLSGSFDLRFLPLEQIERVEILKGSQSTLYGPDAIAGVINIISRKPADDRPVSVRGSASYGSLNTFEGSIGVSGTAGSVGYDVSYQKYVTDGISEAANPSDTVRFDKDGAERDAVQATIDYAPAAGIKISPYFRYSAWDSDFDGGSFTDAANTNVLRLYNPGFSTDVALGPATLRANYGYTQTDRTFENAFGESSLNGALHNADLYFTTPINDVLQVVGGINYQRQQMLDTTTVVVDPSISLVSPYATLLLRNWRGFNAELGYRFNHHSAYGSNSTFSVAPAYYVTDQIQVFASYTTGFKVPTLFQLYAAPFGNQALRPQRSRTVEVGSQVLSSNGRVTAQATYFRRHLDDVIIFLFVPGYLNQDEQDGSGIELTASWQIARQLRVSGQYTYLDGETTTPGSQEQDSSFVNLLRRPRHSLTASVRYQPLPRLNLSVQGLFQSERDDLFFDPVTFVPASVTLSSFVLINAHADYQLPGQRFTFFVDIKNLTNSSYEEVYGFNTLGRNGQAGVQFNLF